MKKTWMAACLAAFLALPLAGCAGDQTSSNVTGPSAQPSQSAAPSPSAAADPNPGDDDLAGADGIVGGADDAGDIGTGNTGNDNAPGQADDSPLEDLGDGVQDTLDDMGSAARDMGRDARDAIEGR